MKDHLDAEHLEKAGLRLFFPAGDNSDLSQRGHRRARRHPGGERGARPRGRPQGDAHGRGRAAHRRRSLGRRCERPHPDDQEAAGPRAGRGAHDQRGLVPPPERARHRGVGRPRQRRVVRPDGRARHPQVFDEPPDGRGILGVAHPALVGTHLDRHRRRPALSPLPGDALENAIGWLDRHEPQLAASLRERSDEVEDFLKIEDFAYDCQRVFSPERWALTGIAGCFLDPFYSPGSDYIGPRTPFSPTSSRASSTVRM